MRTRIVPVAAISAALLFALSTVAAVIAPRPAGPHPPLAARPAPIPAEVDVFSHQWQFRPPAVLEPTTTTSLPSAPKDKAAPAVPPTRPRPRSRSTAVGAAPNPSSVWACIARHESGGNPAENTGNGYSGEFQFSASTWDSMHTGYARASDAPASVQLAAAQALQRRSGWGQWPVTSRLCGA
jgi:Transglycosylase-like domain